MIFLDGEIGQSMPIMQKGDAGRGRRDGQEMTKQANTVLAARRKMAREIASMASTELGLPGGRPIDKRVLRALEKVPRHEFVPANERSHAYENRPLPIGMGQTISQPYIVAVMTDLLQLEPSSKVLEIGTGSGYQTAVLSELCARVFSVEIVTPLAQGAARKLRKLGYDNVTTKIGDGHAGWPEEAPFDAIIVTAAPDHVPPRLVGQLRPGGRLVIPVGEASQELLLIEKQADGSIATREVLPVKFVPLKRLGRAETKAG